MPDCRRLRVMGSICMSIYVSTPGLLFANPEGVKLILLNILRNFWGILQVTSISTSFQDDRCKTVVTNWRKVRLVLY